MVWVLIWRRSSRQTYEIVQLRPPMFLDHGTKLNPGSVFSGRIEVSRGTLVVSGDPDVV